MRRATKIATDILAADEEKGGVSPRSEKNKTEEIDDEQLRDLILHLIKTIYKKQNIIKTRGTQMIRRWMELNSGSTVKDCLIALSLIR